MLNKLIPVLFLALGIGAGVGVALWSGASGPEHAEDVESAAAAESHGDVHGHGPAAGEREYIKMNNQFVVPIIKTDRVTALVVLSLSLEMEPGSSELVYAKEPKLRDGFLRVLFDHANIGGFQGAFTRAENLETLRRSLRDVAQMELGDKVSDVLIVDIARQDT